MPVIIEILYYSVIIYYNYVEYITTVKRGYLGVKSKANKGKAWLGGGGGGREEYGERDFYFL